MVSAEVIVVGGGLAGIAAALDLAKAGRRVALLERTSWLGGRAGSTCDKGGTELDVGQHVYLGCCTEFRGLLCELGTAHLAPLAKGLDLALIDAGAEGRPQEAKLKAAPLPYPLSLAGALIGYGHLTARERLQVIRLVVRAVTAYRSPTVRRRLSQTSFSQWLKGQGTGPGAVQRLWEPLIVAALNADTESVSAEAGVMVLAKGLAGGPRAASIGLFRAPMSRLLDPVGRILAPHGDVLLDHPVRALIVEDGRVCGVQLANGKEMRSRCVVLATSHVHLAALLPGAWADDPFFAAAARLPARPIANVHLWYDRPITNRAMTGVLNSPLQWIFDLTTLYGEPTKASEVRHYCISLSDAADAMATAQSQLVTAMDQAVRRAFPMARDARLVRGLARKMRHATFSCAPGMDRLRPTNETPIAGLFLAGDYTTTGWPATMESAVISGRRAAALALRRLARD